MLWRWVVTADDPQPQITQRAIAASTSRCQERRKIDQDWEMNQTLDCAVDVAGVSDIFETLCGHRPAAAQRGAPLHIRYATQYRRYRSYWYLTRVLASTTVITD